MPQRPQLETSPEPNPQPHPVSRGGGGGHNHNPVGVQNLNIRPTMMNTTVAL